MNLKNYLIIFLVLLSSTFCLKSIEAREFEENEINSESQQFIYKTSKPSMIILIIKNEKIIPNTDDNIALTIINTETRKTEEINLSNFYSTIISDSQNKENAEYILKFKNYEGGKFIIYNSANAYPLKDLEKGYNLDYKKFNSYIDINLSFTTEILKEDTLLDVYPGEQMKIIKTSETGVEQPLEIYDNSAKLSKDFKYRIEFNENHLDRFSVAIKKREIINYKINDEVKLNLFKGIPFFFLLEVSEYDTEMIYSYMYSMDESWYNISISEIESKNIDDWDKIYFYNETIKLYSQYVYRINSTKLSKENLLIKYIPVYNSINFFTFKIFQNVDDLSIMYKEKLEKEKLIITRGIRDYIYFATSNISNLRTFEHKDSRKFIYQRVFYYFSYIVTQTSKPFESNSDSLSYVEGSIYSKEKFFRHDLGSLINKITDKSLWLFEISDNYTFAIKYFIGFPKIYYIDEFTSDTSQDLRYQRFDKFKEINSTNSIMNFNTPFIIYIDPYEKSYINIIFSKDDNMDIIEEMANKYLVENKEYYLLDSKKLMIRIDENLDSNINILEDENIKYILNKNNPFVEIDSPNDNLVIVSEQNTIIELYRNISYLFPDEHIDIIEYPIDKKGEIMIIHILSYESKDYSYAMDYGYDYYISPDTKKIITTQTYFFIDDPYSELLEKKDNLRYYLILFDENIKYEITFKKKYVKKNNLPYYIIESEDNKVLVSDLNYQKGYFTYQVLLCENKEINLTRTDINNKTEIITTNKLFVNEYNKRSLFTFEAKSKFLFIQKENGGYKNVKTEIKYYIPNIENEKIFLLLLNDYSYDRNDYTFILVEDNNNDDILMNNLDNECYMFSLVNGEIENINYIIHKDFIYDGQYFYTELDYSKFSNPKNILIKIFSCENKSGVCLFSKVRKINLEKLKKDEEEKEEEFGIKKIEEFTEYNITRQDYIFSYYYNPYPSDIEDIMIYITVPTTSYVSVGDFEVINPLMQSFKFKYSYSETVQLIKGEHVTSSGRYYFIFRNDVGVQFYLHNIIHFFPLNKINNFLFENEHRISNYNGILYFTMNLEEDKYIYVDKGFGDLYMYDIHEKTTKRYWSASFNQYKIKKGSYIFIAETKDRSSNNLMININHYIVDLEKNREIEVAMPNGWMHQPTVAAVVNLSKYGNLLYLVSDSTYFTAISCEKSMRIEDIVENFDLGTKNLDSHIQKITDKKICDPPYYNIKFYTTRFELVSDVYNFKSSQNLTFQQNDTVAFTIEGNGYNLILSTQENMKWLDIMETEFVDIILSNQKIQFKLKPNENIQTDLQIIILDNEKNIQIENLTNKEISKKIKYNNENEEIKYYINLSKNKYIISHFDYIGKLEFYISKDEINGYNFGEILKTNDINMDLFDKVTNDYFELDNKKILAMKKVNHIYSDLLMTPIFHDFVLENINSKCLIANKRYFIRSYVKILLDENSDAQIKVYDLNNTEIYTINKDNSFENKDYNKLLFLKTDKNTIIYIYHYAEDDSKIFEYPKDINNSIFILFSSDCENNKLEYSSDLGYKNYASYNLELTKLSNSKTFISFAKDSDIKIPKGQSYITYIQCENKAKLLGNSSGFYNYTTSKEGNASYIMEKNKDLFIRNNLDENKKNIFYQIFECEPNTISNNEIYASIDGNGLNRLYENDNYIKGQNSIYFYLKTNDEFLFNYYKTSSDKNKYDSIKKYDNPNFNITILSKNHTKIDILPKYKNINFEFYFFMYIDKENKMSYNPLKNKCYMKKLINNDKIKLNDENIIIKKIEYKDGAIVNNIIETPNLEKGFSIYSNVFGSGNIFDDVEEYLFYTEQKHIIEDSDFPSDESHSDSPSSDTTPTEDPLTPSENPSSKSGLTGGAIAGIVIGAVALILIIAFLVIKFRKKDSLDLENDNKYNPLSSGSNN